MKVSEYQLPDTQTLAKSINATLHPNISKDTGVTILSRESNYHASTFPSEIVTIQLAGGSKLQIFCKYEIEPSHNAWGHRGGVSYEVEIYRQVLQRLPMPSPKFYGAHQDPITGRSWLFLEFVHKSLRLKYFSEPSVIQTAAGWLGRFHKANSALLNTDSLKFIIRHNSEYFYNWAKRTSDFARRLHQRYSWLETLCKCFEDVAGSLTKPPVVITHGEFYPMNILYSRGKIYPVDWESTAVAAGEIDLASLTENWPPEFEQAAKVEYQQTRWPEGSPPEFEKRLDAAQLYWQFRWLGDRPEWTVGEKGRIRFEQLKIIGERMGLI